MKNKMFPMPLVLALFAFTSLFAASAHSVEFQPSAITFVDSDNERNIHVFVKGDNDHLVSNHFNGTTWEWTDHGLPPGATSITSPKAVTYVDDAGHRRIYVFAIDNDYQLVVRFHKGPGYDWQWSQQGGPSILGSSLSATTFLDDNGVRRIYAFGFRVIDAGGWYQMWTNSWNGNAWSWAQMTSLPSTNSVISFTEVTNYIGNDGRRRMDVFCSGNGDALLRQSWVEGAWSLTNLGGNSTLFFASAVNYLDSSGYRKVDTFTLHPEYWTIWDRHSGGWSDIGIPATAVSNWSGHISATTYSAGGFPRIDVFANWDHKLYQRRWINLAWQPWVDLGKPYSSLVSSQTADVEYPTAITYLDMRSGNQHTWVFMTGGGRLYANRWNGTSWQWKNLGNP